MLFECIFSFLRSYEKTLLSLIKRRWLLEERSCLFRRWITELNALLPKSLRRACTLPNRQSHPQVHCTVWLPSPIRTWITIQLHYLTVRKIMWLGLKGNGRYVRHYALLFLVKKYEFWWFSPYTQALLIPSTNLLKTDSGRLGNPYNMDWEGCGGREKLLKPEPLPAVYR